MWKCKPNKSFPPQLPFGYGVSSQQWQRFAQITSSICQFVIYLRICIKICGKYYLYHLFKRKGPPRSLVIRHAQDKLYLSADWERSNSVHKASAMRIKTPHGDLLLVKPGLPVIPVMLLRTQTQESHFVEQEGRLQLKHQLSTNQLRH